MAAAVVSEPTQGYSSGGMSRSSSGGVYSNPAYYNTIRQQLLKKYKKDEVDKFLSKKVALEQGPEAVEMGLIEPDAAITAAGGIGAPGVLDNFSDVPAKDEFAGKKRIALEAVAQLEKRYGRGDAENIGTDKDLSLAGKGGRLDRPLAGIKKAFAGGEFVEDQKIYDAALANLVGVFSQSFGSGTPQEGESQRLIKSAPGGTSSDKEAKAWFEDVRVFLGDKKKDDKGEIKNSNIDRSKYGEEIGGIATPLQKTTTSKSIVNTEPEQSQEDQGLFRNIALKAADAAPAVGALIGGTAGAAATGIPTLGLGAFGGGVVGATAGGGGGLAIQNLIREQLGVETRSSEEVLKDVTTGAARDGAFQALGFGAGKYVLGPALKGAGWVLKHAGSAIDDIPLRSIRINPSQLTKFEKQYGEDVADFMTKRGYLGEDAVDLAAKDAAKHQEAFDELALNKNIQIPVQKLAQRFSEEISDLGGAGDKIVPSINKGIAKSILGEWANIEKQIVKQGREFVTPEDLTLFRRAISDVIPDSQWVDPSVKNTAVRTYRIINDVIQDNVGEKGVLKATGIELSKLYKFLEIASKQDNLGRGSLVGNITRMMGGVGGAGLGFMAGGPLGGVTGGIAGLAAEGALRNPNVLKGIYNTSRAAGRMAPAMKKGISALPPALAAVSQSVNQMIR